ncbi:MAG: hypothetical protein JW748_01805 [Anaerolineales bacterium]|nr:hypothetical protein [Anaerolineales bacterium]
MEFSNLDWNALTRSPSTGVHLSLYMPTHPTGREKAQDPIRLRNMIRSAEKQLRDNGWRASAIEEFTASTRILLQTPGYWRRQGLGLAVFSSSDTRYDYHLPIRPPRTLAVSRRFHVKPLMPLLYDDGLFFILAISQNEVRTLWGTRDRVLPVELKNVPGSMAEAIGPISAEKHLQWHTRTGDTSGWRRRAAVFHGQGGGIDGKKDDLLRFFQLVDHGVAQFLGNRRIPLIVAGVDFLLPIYRKANTYPNLAAVLPIGNPERLHAAALQKSAWDALRPVIAQRREDAFLAYRRLAGAGDERACDDLKTILAAAFQGRVESVFVNPQVQEWGSYEPDSGRMTLTPAPQDGAEDLLDLAAIQTFLHRGSVFVVNRGHIPSGSDIAAQLRF